SRDNSYGSSRGTSYSGSSSSSPANADKPVGGASAIPPSLWGKTLRRVASVPTPPASAGASSPSGMAGASSVGTSSTSKPLAVGCVIEHSRFGRGKVVSVEGSGLDTKAVVEFDNVGRKQLLLRFAKFDVIG
ncbi:MAG: hypothetical protein MJZ60_01935, partial [Bacteroidaceae bacterium]|nr:hypothetical protein [Bacteroidaceae bacterium]